MIREHFQKEQDLEHLGIFSPVALDKLCILAHISSAIQPLFVG